PVGYATLDADAAIREVNLKGSGMLGEERRHVLGKKLTWFIGQQSLSDINVCLQMLSAGNERQSCEVQLRSQEKEAPWVLIEAALVRKNGRPEYRIVLSDISARKRAEAEKEKLLAKLIQSRKMEAIGRIAGGVAHEFNNMLTVFFVAVDLMKMQCPYKSPIFEHISAIERASMHGKEIVRQLLTFSQKQLISPTLCDLNALISSLGPSLEHMAGQKIELCLDLQPEMGTIKADFAQMNQLIAALASNGRDAMPDGGKLTIATADVDLDAEFCSARADLNPGPHVRIQVSDTGVGMDHETLANIFEPFFTTKEVGAGSGLGLPTIYGIVRQAGGFIDVQSETGHGSVFTVYFPIAATSAERGEPDVPDELPRGHETILLVDDNEMLLRVTGLMLEHLGYAVTAVSSPAAALSLIKEQSQSYNLLIADVIMPGLNGAQLHDKIACVQPNMKVLFMSGYTAEIIGEMGRFPDSTAGFIQKPFTVDELARKVRVVLDGLLPRFAAK
ncbi:MAG TPA: ATP-binding protein, partial [Dissulfurispiraceae bacterium]|nr:ATP-binding protein [Dissulfurispiraceae bacterium]